MSWRKITVLDKDYEYHIGKSNVKVRGFPAASFAQVTGRSWTEIERGQHKKTSDGMVTPKHVADFIRSQVAK